MTAVQHANMYDVQAASIIRVDGWSVYSYRAGEGGVVLVGAVAPLFARGKRKGRRNWRKMDKSTERTVVISESDHKAFCMRWQADTGNCFRCIGKGTRVRSWSATDGAVYEKCPHCEGGKVKS